jgi:hypothetical protein
MRAGRGRLASRLLFLRPGSVAMDMLSLFYCVS